MLFLDILKSGGNENLSIESIKVKSGDVSAFNFDLSSLQAINIKPNSIIKLPVTFSPTKLGEHQITLEITSDAAPNYGKVTNEVMVNALSIPEDTSKTVLEVQAPNNFIYCQNNYIIPYIVNKGNVKLTLQKLTCKSSGINDVKWVDSLNTAKDLNPGDTAKFKLCSNAI